MMRRFLLAFAAFVSIGIIACVAAYMWLVVYFPGDAIRLENIEKTLAVESPVYYSDGRTKIGVFFQEAHRQYVPYDDLPENFINGIIASEDHEFFRHYGIDLPGFARAMYANVKAGRIVQGGSTITQQAAKNLFKRKGRSFKAKLTELLYALRLEYHYSKEKILEFYANQFYVSGNGRGLGVAARYFFDKEPRQLDVVEAAFIAGSVKRPNYYNPFIKKDETGAEKARERAKGRTGYVLGQMYKLGMITPDQYQQAIRREIPFNKGRMRFRLNMIMDLVKEGLDDPSVEEALGEHGIDNIATSGLRVITTIDKDLQKSSLFALQSELSRLDVRLLGYDREKLQERYGRMPFGVKNPEKGQMLVGRVLAVNPASPPSVTVTIAEQDDDSGARGTIDEAGLMHLLESLVKYERQRWARASEKDLPLLLDKIKVGDLVYLATRENDPMSGEYLFDLEKYPEIEGAVLVRRKGRILSLVGGMDNYYYNRAVTAKRPMGSVVKPLLYAAALQLGWSSLDLLNNTRAMFVYQNTPYIPRPDHKSPFSHVSMSWAGVHSENVASVWLLYHLCDHLTPAQFKELLERVGMAREEEESYNHYLRRVRDSMGIVVNEAALRQTAFEKAVTDSEADLIFAGRQDELQSLKLFYYSDEYEKLADGGTDLESEVRRQVVMRNFVRYLGLRESLAAMAAGLERGGTFFEGAGLANLYYRPERGGRNTLAATAPPPLSIEGSFVYSDSYPGKSWFSIDRAELARFLAGMTEGARRNFWSSVKIDDTLSLETIDLIDTHMQAEYERLTALTPYEPEVLHAVRDFRVLAGLRYLIGLCRAMGVTSTLEPVLSFPLGSNVISLLEVTRIYEAITSGMAYSFGNGDKPGLAVIDRIENSEGEVIHRVKVEERRVMDRQTALEVSDILRNVVKYGTGRYAKNNIRLRSNDPEVAEQLADLDLGVPVLGKTGTANRFTNSAFAGLVPGLHGEGNGVNLDHGSFTVASYVGFDDNRPMIRKTTHITGASGALPIWTKVADSIIYWKNYAEAMDLVDLAFSGRNAVPLYYPDLGQLEVAVAVHEGGIIATETMADDEKAPVVAYGRFLPGGVVELNRTFRPYWHWHSTRQD